MNKIALQIEIPSHWLQLIILYVVVMCVCVFDAKRDGMTATTIEKLSSLELNGIKKTKTVVKTYKSSDKETYPEESVRDREWI